MEEPSVQWLYWIGEEEIEDQPVTIDVINDSGSNIVSLETTGSYGFNQFNWNLALPISGKENDSNYLSQGNYTLIFNLENQKDEVSFTIK